MPAAAHAIGVGQPRLPDRRRVGLVPVRLARNFQTFGGAVDKILKGEKPAEIPFEQATKLELVIDKKAAKALGMAVPQALLLSADEIIE